MRANPLGPADQADARALLARDAVTNLFLLDKIDAVGIPGAPGDRWLGVRGPDGTLLALAYANRDRPRTAANTLVPCGDPSAARWLGEGVRADGGTRMLVGPRAACDAVWTGMGSPPPRRKHDQHLYVADAPPAGDALPIGRARPEDLEPLLEMQIGMLEDDLGITRDEIDVDILRKRVMERILGGSSLVARDGGAACFTVYVGFRCRGGAQVGGTYVPVARRGRGIATRAMRGVVRMLLADGLPRVTLHVNEANTPAVRCYVAAGFRPHTPFRLMVL
jgi:GNAT superfamily N-acetyltransferase